MWEISNELSLRPSVFTFTLCIWLEFDFTSVSTNLMCLRHVYMWQPPREWQGAGRIQSSRRCGDMFTCDSHHVNDKVRGGSIIPGDVVTCLHVTATTWMTRCGEDPGDVVTCLHVTATTWMTRCGEDPESQEMWWHVYMWQPPREWQGAGRIQSPRRCGDMFTCDSHHVNDKVRGGSRVPGDVVTCLHVTATTWMTRCGEDPESQEMWWHVYMWQPPREWQGAGRIQSPRRCGDMFTCDSHHVNDKVRGGSRIPGDVGDILDKINCTPNKCLALHANICIEGWGRG